MQCSYSCIIILICTPRPRRLVLSLLCNKYRLELWYMKKDGYRIQVSMIVWYCIWFRMHFHGLPPAYLMISVAHLQKPKKRKYTSSSKLNINGSENIPIPKNDEKMMGFVIYRKFESQSRTWGEGLEAPWRLIFSGEVHISGESENAKFDLNYHTPSPRKR